MLSVAMMFILLNVIMLNVVMVNVVAPVLFLFALALWTFADTSF
jgi:hypothetical protein